MNKPEEIINRMNDLGKQGEPFVFLIDFLGQKPKIFPLKESSGEILWHIPDFSNVVRFQTEPSQKIWNTNPVSFEKYKTGFDQIQQHINNGDTYLLNFTQPTLIETNLSLEEIFHLSSAPYKIYLKNQFVCFSPETFVKIDNGKIYSFPMKGTIDAGIDNAEELILKDTKEVAEHNTIVDLIRNDLSLISENVKVEKFRYLSHIQTNQKNLWQVSSKISGDLPDDFAKKIGDIIFAMLPAGSISGAPKKKTLEIIEKSENYDRGYYTGIFGIFDGKNLDSCVLIRYIENQNGQLIYKSGGGITFMSEAEKEYEEMLKKVYVPIA
ncbi:MAG: aminodeoxychorismate synthase component I [Prolixibacteraceae bacterium]|jgi:para-aminobenzoate synthetase component I|nr:aminodeoxychorismate synthase component I [Prolixibacteraceae bacterium]MBT6006462.1 aminodeoxychorismate synthase component I [Prolixibacteraceae bacterium]MBT6765041.1 aminodeoxychorismate synthase component I [Prolixibacteraceae bacterium]MBT7000158.1 aminodeoxychorismate synthase component I [Prolixibacteraceae bacterium]MBT7395648.1 aminodeoxychorismate synthase component I [Prolixibacteraceae bacterium]